MALQEVRHHIDGMRQNIALRQQQAADGVGLWFARLPERTRRMAVNGLNLALAGAITGLSYIVIDSVVHSPDLARLPADILQSLAPLQHLPLHNMSQASQDLMEIGKNTFVAAANDVMTAGNAGSNAALALEGDGIATTGRLFLNSSERQRRYGGPYLHVKDVIPGRRTTTP